jgi:hypothetical protein
MLDTWQHDFVHYFRCIVSRLACGIMPDYARLECRESQSVSLLDRSNRLFLRCMGVLHTSAS